MIVLISGGVGTGKTCLLTKYLVTSHRKFKRKVIVNYDLKKTPYDKLDIVDLYLNHPELKGYVIGGDELYTFMDCRCSMKKRNRLESYFIAQTRKKSCDLYFTSQFSDFVDYRLILFVNVWVKMSNIWLRNKKTGRLHKHPYKFRMRIMDFRTDDLIIKEYIFDGRKWFNEYDTDEPIYPPDDYLETEKQMVVKNNKN